GEGGGRGRARRRAALVAFHEVADDLHATSVTRRQRVEGRDLVTARLAPRRAEDENGRQGRREVERFWRQAPRRAAVAIVETAVAAGGRRDDDRQQPKAETAPRRAHGVSSPDVPRARPGCVWPSRSSLAKSS